MHSSSTDKLFVCFLLTNLGHRLLQAAVMPVIGVTAEGHERWKLEVEPIWKSPGLEVVLNEVGSDGV